MGGWERGKEIEVDAVMYTENRCVICHVLLLKEPISASDMARAHSI